MRRRDHLTFGGVIAAIGGAVVAVFSVRAVAGTPIYHSVGFDIGISVMALGALIAIWGWWRGGDDKAPADVEDERAAPPASAGLAAIHAAGHRSQWTGVKVYDSPAAILSTGDDQTFTDIEVSQGAPPLRDNFDRDELRGRTAQLARDFFAVVEAHAGQPEVHGPLQLELSARFGREFRDVVQQHWSLGIISAAEHARLRGQFRVPPADAARHAILAGVSGLSS